MPNDPNFLAIVPPVIAILLAILTRQVFLSLFTGIWMGYFVKTATVFSYKILAIKIGGYLNLPAESIGITLISRISWFFRSLIISLVDGLEGLVRVFADSGNTKVIMFSTLVGALITFTQYSGGMEGFVQWITRKGFVKNRRSAGLVAWLIGTLVFIESSICVLVTGAISRPLFDKFKISREKLAYIADSTSAPKCVLIPLNAWGAFIIALLTAQGVTNPWQVMFYAIPFNFYAWLAILLVLIIVFTGRDFGPMKAAEKRVREEGKILKDGSTPLVSEDVMAVQKKAGIPARAVNMLLPIGVMIVMMPLGLIITGDGDITAGSGSTAVFWSVISALIVAALSYRWQKIMGLKEIMEQLMKGLSGLIPLALLMMMAFAIGDVCKILGTGPFVAGLAKNWGIPQLMPAMIFLVSCFIAFSTGTSWGTFAIMIPIAVPTAVMLNLPMALTVAAVLGGGVFGDHCSPISDTTIIASMASGTDHIDHVRTQLPYAVTAAAVALIGYLIAGLIFI